VRLANLWQRQMRATDGNAAARDRPAGSDVSDDLRHEIPWTLV
jgi:hypothetical protein